MKLIKYQQLKENNQNSNFETNYSIIDRILYYFSFLGNIASIIFAYFFVNKLLYDSVDDFWGKFIVVPLITTISLTSFELLKRFLFKQTTVNILNAKKVNSEIIFTIILSLILIIGSFFLSLNGAKTLANKNKVIDNKIENIINIKTDSLSKIYDIRINKLDSDKISYMKMITGITKNAKLISQYNSLLNKTNEDIKELNKEKEVKIKELEAKFKDKSVSDKKEVNSNITSFLFISGFIEIIILIGVWFDSYYTFRIFKEFDNKVNEDSNYRNYFLYTKLLEIIYNNGKLMVGETFDSFNKIREISKIKGTVITDKHLKDFFVILKYLKISNTIGNRRMVEKNYEQAKEILSDYYKIK